MKHLWLEDEKAETYEADLATELARCKACGRLFVIAGVIMTPQRRYYISTECDDHIHVEVGGETQI